MPLFASDAHLASAISNRAIFALQVVFFNGPSGCPRATGFFVLLQLPTSNRLFDGPLGCPQATGPKATEGGIL